MKKKRRLLNLIKNISSWSELETKIAALPTEIEKGEVFEEFCKAFFLLDPVFQFEKVYRCSEIPPSLRKQIGHSGIKDIGIDGVAITYDKRIVAYQAKFRSDRNNGPTLRELSTFFTVSDRADWRITITNANTLPTAINSRIKSSRVLADRLDLLEADFFNRVRVYLFKRKVALPKPNTPKPFQKEAIKQAISYFQNNSRGQLILPCGTGKTLTALWIIEKLGYKKILMMVPSLSLLSQALREWAANTSLKPFPYLCLCSDTSVDLGNDAGIEHLYEMDVPVTTDTRVVAEFLKNKTSIPSILFSTYQSSKVLSQAVIKAKSCFDIAIFDEAHRTTGTKVGVWNIALDDKKVPITKRVFMTATPRIYASHVTKKARENDIPICSMDDEAVYGKSFFKMTFSKAIEEKLITDYRVVVICVTDPEVRALLNKRSRIVTDNEYEWNANALAKRIALVKGINQYGLKKIFTFHGRISSAKAFTDKKTPFSIHHVVNMITPKLSKNQNLNYSHVNGKMSSGLRNSLLKEFKEADIGIMSNARCLTEGVDVPAVDTVAFIDPKRSLIDIVQATGRAMRKAEWKEKGYIFIPVLVEEDKNLESFIESSDFDTVWKVLQAMLEQDEYLQEIVSNLRIMQGKGEEGTKVWKDTLSDFNDKVEFFNLPVKINKSKFINGLYAKTVEIIGRSWDFWYGLTLKYKEEFGTPNALRSYVTPDGIRLSIWQGHQRKNYKKGKLSFDRIQRLNDIGFSWSIFDDAFEKGFQETLKHKKQAGDPNAPLRCTSEGFNIGMWQCTKRLAYKKRKLTSDKIRRLEEIGFIWDHFDDAFEQGYQEYLKYKKQSESSVIPKNLKTTEGLHLGNWQGTQRQFYKKGKLSIERIKKLEDAGFIWDVFEADFDRGLKETITYKKQFNTANAPNDYKTPDGFKLGSWQQNQRYKYKHKKLSSDKIQRLEALGFVWNILDDSFEKGFRETLRYNEQYGTPNAHQHYTTPEGFPLGQWQSGRRQAYRRKKLEPVKINKLESIGFSWNLIDYRFDKGIMETIKYKQLTGSIDVPHHYITTGGFKLGIWQQQKRQAYKKGKLSSDKIRRLESIGFSWTFIDKDFEKGFQETLQHKRLFGVADAHISYKTPDGYSLGHWQGMLRQSYKKGQIDLDKIQRMTSIGFTWDTFERGVRETIKYKKLFGTANAPVSYRTPEGFNLGSWQSVQRKAIRKGQLSYELVKKLRDIGFKW